MGVLTQAARSLGHMLTDGVRVIGLYLPTLLAVFFLGAAARGGFLWLAIEGSGVHPLLGMAILPLASVAMLVALVLMLRVVAPALPHLRDSLVPGEGPERLRANLVLAVQVLIPFLAVYSSMGMMKEDLRNYVMSGTADEWMNAGFNADFGRVGFGTDAQIIVIVILALVLRKVIAGFNLSARGLGVAGFAGYLEALWLITLAAYFTSSINDIRDWVMGRVAIVNIISAFDAVIEVLGPIGSLIQGAISAVMGVVSAMGSLVIVPVAWIAVGATIYGAALPSAKPMLTSEQMTRRIQRVPGRVRRVAAQVAEPVVGPVRNTAVAISRIAVAGVIPMVLLCVIFYATSELRVLVSGGLRSLLGAREPGFWVAFTPHIDLIAQAVYMTVMIALLAAAVNAVIRAIHEEGARAQARADSQADAEAHTDRELATEPVLATEDALAD